MSKSQHKGSAMTKMRPTTWKSSGVNCETKNSIRIQKLELGQRLPKIPKRKQKSNPKKEILPSRGSQILPSISASIADDNVTNRSDTSNPSIGTHGTPSEVHLQLPPIARRVDTLVAGLDRIESALSLNADIEKSPSVARVSLRIVNDLRLVLLHANADTVQKDFEDSIHRFYPTFREIEKFQHLDKCIDFVQRNVDQTIFLIVSHDLAQAVLPVIHGLRQIDSVYILCVNIPKRKRWIHQWTKVKDMYTSIDRIYDIVKEASRVGRRGSIVISETSIDLNRLDSSFMYTKLLKEILLSISYDGRAKEEFVKFCRQKYYSVKSQKYLEVIDELEEDYHKHSSVWWYTRDCFLHRLVNEAIRLQEIDVIIKMGFFIQDLQRQIEQLYKRPTQRCTFYRGQGLSHVDSNQLLMMEGGLLSFSSFLSTTTDERVAIMYALSAAQDSNLKGIVFKIIVHPAALTSTRFASLGKEGYYLDTEDEVLFTMHSIFRIDTITQREDQLMQVNLSLTSDDDVDLRKVTDYIREQTQGTTGWNRLGKLLLGLGVFEKAEEVYQVLLSDFTEDDIENRGHRCHMLGRVKKCQGDDQGALDLFSMAVEIYTSSSDSNHMCLATIYNDIGSVYHHPNEFATALKYHEMALEKQKHRVPRNRSELLITYGYLADVHKSMKQITKALSYYKHQLTILKKCHPVKDLYLAVVYENIAGLYDNLKRYPSALTYLKKAFNIRQRCPVRDEIQIAAGFNNISKIHEKTGEYQEAIEQCKEAHNLLRRLVPVDYSELAKICERIGALCEKVKNFAEALTCYQETLRYLQKSPECDTTSLARVHDDIGRIYEEIGEDEKAYYSYRNAVEAERKASFSSDTQLQLYRKHFRDIQQRHN